LDAAFRHVSEEMVGPGQRDRANAERSGAGQATAQCASGPRGARPQYLRWAWSSTRWFSPSRWARALAQLFGLRRSDCSSAAPTRGIARSPGNREDGFPACARS